jgi:hypothetical protein
MNTLLLLLLLLLLNQLYNPGWVLACSRSFFQASLSSLLAHEHTAGTKFSVFGVNLGGSYAEHWALKG